MVVRQVAVGVRTPQFVVPLFAVGNGDRRVSTCQPSVFFCNIFLIILSVQCWVMLHP